VGVEGRQRPLARAVDANSGRAPYPEVPLPSSVHLQIEAAIARAHRSLATARDQASVLTDLGLHDDLQMLLLELERLQVDLLKSSRPRRSRVYGS
jgi:hypothetical protein